MAPSQSPPSAAPRPVASPHLTLNLASVVSPPSAGRGGRASGSRCVCRGESPRPPRGRPQSSGRVVFAAGGPTPRPGRPRLRASASRPAWSLKRSGLRPGIMLRFAPRKESPPLSPCSLPLSGPRSRPTPPSSPSRESVGPRTARRVGLGEGAGGCRSRSCARSRLALSAPSASLRSLGVLPPSPPPPALCGPPARY